MTENFPNLGKETDITIQEVQRTPIKISQSRPTPRHRIDNFTKYTDEERILKVAREEKSLTHREDKSGS